MLRHRRPPRSTRTYTCFPYTTPFRAVGLGRLVPDGRDLQFAVRQVDVLELSRSAKDTHFLEPLQQRPPPGWQVDHTVGVDGDGQRALLAQGVEGRPRDQA